MDTTACCEGKQDKGPTPEVWRAKKGARLAPRRPAALPREAVRDRRHVRVQAAQVQEAGADVSAAQAHRRGCQAYRPRRRLGVSQPVFGCLCVRQTVSELSSHHLRIEIATARLHLRVANVDC